MSSRKLPNYLRSHRKRAGFTQEEIAWLLGCRYYDKVSRYERFVQHPVLPTALAYEVIFQVPARELFPGVFEEVEGATAKRAAELARRLEGQKLTRATSAKLTALRAICREHQENGADQDNAAQP